MFKATELQVCVCRLMMPAVHHSPVLQHARKSPADSCQGFLSTGRQAVMGGGALKASSTVTVATAQQK